MTRKLECRVAALENATGVALDIGAELSERLAEMRRNAKRAESDPEFATRLQREAHEREAQMEQDFRAGRLDGIELRLFLARMKDREEKLEQ